MNGWMIDKDCAEVGGKLPVFGPRNISTETQEALKRGEGTPFRMYDDDNELYYEGFLFGNEFGPLDDYGTPNAGCTRIDVFEKKDGKEGWVTV
jgi:hypothetical protein